MLIAETVVIVGKKTFQKGQTVTGLSAIDKEWMKMAGLIKEVVQKKEDKKEIKAVKDEL